MSAHLDIVHHHIHSADLSLRDAGKTGRPLRNSVDFARWHLRKALSEANRTKHPEKFRVLRALSSLQSIEHRHGLIDRTKGARVALYIGAAVLVGLGWIQSAHAADGPLKLTNLAWLGAGAIVFIVLLMIALRYCDAPPIVDQSEPPTFI